MAKSDRCPICRLSPDLKSEYDSRAATGLTATALVEFLGSHGILVTPQQIYNHKKHSKPTHTDKQPIIIPKRIASQVSESGLTQDEIQLRIQDLVLKSLDTLYEKLEYTQDSRTARVFIEMADLANRITKDRQERDGLPEPNVQVQITLESLEESLRLPDSDYEPLMKSFD